MTTIYASNTGMPILLDDEDVPLIAGHTWRSVQMHNNHYAYCTTGRRNVAMHRMILRRELDASELSRPEIDHKDRNGLNNQRVNLRICTHAQNLANKPAPVSNTSGFKGVQPEGPYWKANITHEGKSEQIGTFTSPRDAAIAYDLRARELAGDFALPNITDASDEETTRVRALMKSPKKRRNTSSTFKGVSIARRKYGIYWTTHLMYHGTTHSKCFKTELEAARFYNETVRQVIPEALWPKYLNAA